MTGVTLVSFTLHLLIRLLLPSSSPPLLEIQLIIHIVFVWRIILIQGFTWIARTLHLHSVADNMFVVFSQNNSTGEILRQGSAKNRWPHNMFLIMSHHFESPDTGVLRVSDN